MHDRSKKGKSALCALLCALALAFGPSLTLADEGGGFDTAKEGGIGSAAALTSLVYGPLKLAYATVGTVTAGLAWIFSGGDSEVASTVLTRAVRGTYVITPETLVGEREIEFVGRSPQYRSTPASAQVASAPEADGW